MNILFNGLAITIVCYFILLVCIRHLTPASSLWLQEVTVPDGQSKSLVSLPIHCTLFNTIDPVPWPKNALKIAVVPVIIYSNNNY